MKNLVFEPVQRVVLEEYTGSSCGNCPLGIVAIENLERIYGDRFIPLTLRCYGGDILGGPEAQRYSNFLGLMAAPTGRINRSDIIAPMASEGDNYFFTAEGIEGEAPTWLDQVQTEMSNGTVAQIDIQPSYNAATGNVSATCTVRSAINLSAQSISLLGVISENNLVTYQENYRYTTTDSNLGEWGAGGIYGSQLVYPYVTNDVVRGCYGTTFNGTGGLIPTDLKAGEDYKATISGALPANVTDPDNCFFTVMMIDGNTNRIINAHRMPLTADSGVDNVTTDSGEGSLKVAVSTQTVTVTGNGPVNATLFNLQGAMLAHVSGENTVQLEAAKGIVILEATDQSGHIVRKLVIR